MWIKFVAIGDKCSIEEQFEYVEGILEKMHIQ